MNGLLRWGLAVAVLIAVVFAARSAGLVRFRGDGSWASSDRPPPRG